MPMTFVIDVEMEDVDQVNVWVREEIERAQSEGVKWEAFQFVEIGEDGYRMAHRGTIFWLPEYGRAGIEFGADVDWTDARSPEEALERWANDEMIN